MYHRHDEKGLNWEPGGVRSRGPQFRSESGVVRIIRDLGCGVLPAVPEAVAGGDARMQRTGQTLPCQAPSRPSYIPRHPSLNRRCNTSTAVRRLQHAGIGNGHRVGSMTGLLDIVHREMAHLVAEHVLTPMKFAIRRSFLLPNKGLPSEFLGRH